MCETAYATWAPWSASGTSATAAAHHPSVSDVWGDTRFSSGLCELLLGVLQLSVGWRRRCSLPSVSSERGSSSSVWHSPLRTWHFTGFQFVSGLLSFKTAVLVQKCLHDKAPRYLSDLYVLAASADVVSHALQCPGVRGPSQLWRVWS